ncbi:potassium channel family protein [Desulfovibrio oxyclinae]|jgi:voltage-gated potassium channel|uniref:potassium channel family protein n=1 Tax=Desulfovibrio oxyclinae TaxID=63560 RepID=UPI000361F329|nr:potassium channel protein [Desulfovibrio oxyclinae]
MDLSSISRKIRYAKILLFSLLLLFVFGIVGFMFLEKISVIEAMYLTIGTLTTVAPFDLHDEGRVFALILIFFGFGLVATTAAFIGNIFLDANGLELYRRRKVQKKLQKFSDHYIICGHGQMGQIVAAELQQSGKELVVLEREEQALMRCREAGITYLDQDATDEEALVEAGVERAKAVISLVNRDADNVFIVVTARALNPDIFISARANTKGVEKKLYHAGANHVVSPYASAAVRIIQNILRPTITDFLDTAISTEGGLPLQLEELKVPDDAPFVNRTLMDSRIRNDFDLIIVAIQRRNGSRVYNPSSLEPINAGDTLIAIGPRDNLDRFMEMLYGPEALT